MESNSHLNAGQPQDRTKPGVCNEHTVEIKRLSRIALVAPNAKKNAAIDLDEHESTLSHWLGATPHAIPADVIPMLYASTGSPAVIEIVRYLARQLGFELVEVQE